MSLADRLNLCRRGAHMDDDLASKSALVKCLGSNRSANYWWSSRRMRSFCLLYARESTGGRDSISEHQKSHFLESFLLFPVFNLPSWRAPASHTLPSHPIPIGSHTFLAVTNFLTIYRYSIFYLCILNFENLLGEKKNCDGHRLAGEWSKRVGPMTAVSSCLSALWPSLLVLNNCIINFLIFYLFV